MKSVLFLALVASGVWAAEQEGDLNLPVSDIVEMDRQEQEETPEIHEVPMVQKEAKKDVPEERPQPRATPKKD